MRLKSNPILFTFLFLLLHACNDQNEDIIKNSGEIFGTTYSIIYYGRENYEPEIQELFKEVNLSLSTYDSLSLISKINTNQTDSTDNYLRRMIWLSKEVNKETYGFFDPTISSFLKLYASFYNEKKQLKIPSQKEIDSVCIFIGFDKISIKDSKLIKQDARVELDFNAIAKGYTIDLVGELLQKNGIENFLIEIGGEILAKGKKKDGSLWRVGVESPTVEIDERKLLGTISIENKAMATSGNYRKFFYDENSNTKFVHTVNPKTCKAIASDLLSVSVIAKDCAIADAYATAFMSMGKEESLKLLNNKKEIQALLIYNSADKPNKVEFTLINGFPLQQ